MSNATGSVLDAPDAELRTLLQKQWAGLPLTAAESQRLTKRLAVRQTAERETMRSGGRVAESVVPQSRSPQAPAKPTAAYDVGLKETQEAQDYLRGRNDALSGRAQPGAQRPMRESPLSNQSPVEEKIVDNELGTHRSADGGPALWNVPNQVAGRINGGNLNEGANLPKGTTAMMGADGTWKLWKGGQFTDDRYASLQDVGRGNPIGQPAARPTAPAAPQEAQPDPRSGMRKDLIAGVPSAAPAAPRSIEEEEDYIRKSGYGDFIDRAHQAAQESPRSGPAQSPTEAAAMAWFNQGGMLPRPGMYPQPMAPQPMAPQPAPIQPAPMTPMMAEQTPIMPAPLMESPIRPAPVGNQRAQMVADAKRGIGGAAPAAQPAPMFPGALWNTGFGNTWGKQQPYQQAADRFNPFSSPSTEKRRRSIAVMPE